MKRPPDLRAPVVGVFDRRRRAETCLRALHARGFDPSQIGFAGPGVIGTPLDGELRADDAIAPGAPAGAAIGGIAAALEAAGMAPPVAGYCEAQIRAGRFLVTVRGDRPLEAAFTITLQGGNVEGSLSRAVSEATGTTPEPTGMVEGVFASEAVAEAVAEQLRAAFPEREVTVEDGDAPHRVRVRSRP